MDLRKLPKVELHLHLDCSLSFRAVSRLAGVVSQEEYVREYVAPARCTNLADFLSRAPKGFQLMQTEDALRLAAEDLFEQFAEDGVVYAEIRFAPLLHTQRGLTPEQVVAIIEREVDRLSRTTGIEAGVILCTLRHFSEEQGLLTARLVEAFRGSRVVALDLAGDEAGFPLDAHVAAYSYARDRGLFRTAHAGEACGPESVWQTLRQLDPQRIGHGTRSYEDPHLVEHLRAAAIHLELCPSSNVQIIPSIADWADHPINRLYKAGVPLSVSTDTRMLTPTTLTREYENLERIFGWGREELLRTNQMGMEAAFADSATKEKIGRRLKESYGAPAPAQNPIML
jgi:adenosine deaminase